jgi:small-conductance mechanosensitive channel
MNQFVELPPWAWQAASSLLAVSLSYLIGHVVKFVVCRRFKALAARTSGRWDDVLIDELSKRVPTWAVLAGLYVAAGLWNLPPNLNNTLTKLLFVLLTLSLTFFAAALVTRFSVVYSSTLEEALPVTSLTQNIARGVVVTIGLLIVLNGLGLSITPILTALGVGGLAVALALQDTLANLFAGIYVTLAGQIRVGDYVKLDSGAEGYVADIGWRSTRLRMLPNNLVLVPNSKLSQAIVTNFYLPDRELAVLVQVGVDYSSDLRYVERVTSEVAQETLREVPGGVAEFTPFIRYHTFGDSSINFTVIMRAREYADQHILKHEFIKRLHARYAREGITIPFPIRTIVQREIPDEPGPGAREGGTPTA